MEWRFTAGREGGFAQRPFRGKERRSTGEAGCSANGRGRQEEPPSRQRVSYPLREQAVGRSKDAQH